ncbi:Hypp6117 [Branchiostoma lanceolatum]|uniref:Hypp6117 protein n=1 Tax=Branchiostoma lanceolatum TaxID=7740 RepID=A0A8J9W0T3_BRALA|nr:Hypp6117 [Branchiostoma lanceolatum]
MEVVVEPNTGDWREQNGRIRRNRERGRWTREERRQRREESGRGIRLPPVVAVVAGSVMGVVVVVATVHVVAVSRTLRPGMGATAVVVVVVVATAVAKGVAVLTSWISQSSPSSSGRGEV